MGKIGKKEKFAEALKALEVITKKRKEAGWLWIKKGTTEKQIHPDKLTLHLEDNWKLKK
jgi:hypothetical protein